MVRSGDLGRWRRLGPVPVGPAPLDVARSPAAAVGTGAAHRPTAEARTARTVTPDGLVAHLVDRLAGLDRLDAVVGAAYGAVLLAVAVEVAWRWMGQPARRRWLAADAATATAMAAGAAVIGVVHGAALVALWRLYALAVPDAVSGWWSARPALAAGVAFVAWDGAAWLYHWVGHATALGWAAHQPHHSGSSYDLTLGLRQSWTPIHGLAVYPPLALLGIDVRLVLAGAAVSGAWQFAVHTAAPLRPPRWLAATVVTPAAHRHHHGGHGAAVNLGAVFTLWDRLAGTWVPPGVVAPARYGPAEPMWNPVRIQAAGWLALLGRSPGAGATEVVDGGGYRRSRAKGRTGPAPASRSAAATTVAVQPES